MADEKKTIRDGGSDSVRVARVFFTEPQDFPGDQKTSLQCALEPASSGTSYTCVYLPNLQSFEISQFRNGKLNGQDAIAIVPSHGVKRWVRAV